MSQRVETGGAKEPDEASARTALDGTRAALLRADDDVGLVSRRLAWMRESRIWPNGPRYLWTDAFGVVPLVSLHEATGDAAHLREAENVVAEVERVLGRKRGLRIGEAPDRGGQYYHYLAMWMYALHTLGEHRPEARERAVALVRDVHARFVVPGIGVIWKMNEDLSAPYPGFGLGALDPFHGYVVYRLLDEEGLAREIEDMRQLVVQHVATLEVDQDLGLGMCAWFAHFFPEEDWARTLKAKSLDGLERLWIDPPGYFCRSSYQRNLKFAFANHGIAIGLQAVRAHADRVAKIERSFAGFMAGDEYDRNAITHVMGCCALLPGRLIRAPAPSTRSTIDARA